jgi:TonB family protein
MELGRHLAQTGRNMATWRFVAVASLGARLLVGQQAGVSDIKFVDHVPTGFWWRDATTDVKLDFLRAFQAGLSVSGLARFDIPITDLASRLDKFYLVEANRPLTVAKAFMEVTKPSPNPSAAMSLPPPPDITQPPVTLSPLGAPQAKTSPDVYRVGGGVTAPALLYKVEPDYSEEARNAHLEGSVILYAEVDPTGRAVNLRVVRSLGMGLDEKAIEAVPKWKFRPGYKDGKPVTVAATIEVNFRLYHPPPPAEPHNQAEGPGEGRWIRIRSAHFEVNTSAGERKARELIEHFERAYSVFATFTGAMSNQPPTKIVAFASHAEYEPYQITEFAVGYYHQTPDADYIVLDNTATGSLQSVVHEYEHLVARHAGLNVPPWLTEGLAEVYPTLAPRPGGVLIGLPPQGRLDSLLKNEWVPLKTIIDGQNSLYYHEKEKAKGFYDESWALTHMLKMDPKYAPHYADALKVITAGTSSERALKSVYRESIGEIEVDLMAYIRRNPLPTMLVSVNVSETSGAMSAPVELKPSEVKHLLGQLPKAKWHKSIEVHQTSERPSVVAGH